MNTNKNFLSRHVAYAATTAISLFLLISPVDFLSGIAIDDVAYLATTIASVLMNSKAFIDQQEALRKAELGEKFQTN